MIRSVLIVCLVIGLVGCRETQSTAGPTPASVNVYAGLDEQPSIARGGRLYDKWYKVNGAATPKTPHPAYPAEGAYADQAASNWRCKECHGWDYLGRDGAYGRGKHHTGIAGIRKFNGAAVKDVIAVLSDKNHGYGQLLSDTDQADLAMFVTRGQIDMTTMISTDGEVISGSAQRGRAYYATICVGCHGAEGRADDMPVLGKVADDNPWEFIHKVLNGQPGAAMPALRALDRQVAIDIAAYAQTLPTSR